MNNKFVIGIVSLLVGLGLGFALFHHGATPSTGKGPVLGGLFETNTTQFVSGFTAGGTNQFSVDANGNPSSPTYKTATVGTSTSSPAALGSAAAGYFTATTTTQSASTTAITATSQVFLQTASTTQFSTLGAQCNAFAPSTTMVTTLIPGNGFIVKLTPAASGTVTPYCFYYHIEN